MGYDRGRRRGRDKRDGFGEDGFDPFGGGMDGFPPPRDYGDRGGDRFGGGGDRFGGGGGGDRYGGGGGGAPRGGGGGGFSRMPAQIVGTGKGTVKFFNSQKGFGFIQQDGGGEDVFVHISAVERAGLEGLAEGQELQYNLVDRGGKVSAQDLQVVGDVIAVAAKPAAPQRELTGERAKGTVKFFNAMKGFGFLVRDDGQPDAFVHISAVERAGLEGLAEGQELQYNLVDRGGKVSAQDLQVVGDVIAVAAKPAAPQRELTGERVTGTVKFFNAMKGFGFITRDDGQPDAFVHISAVERSGMRELNEGDRLEFDLEVDRRGKHSAVNLVPLNS